MYMTQKSPGLVNQGCHHIRKLRPFLNPSQFTDPYALLGVHSMNFPSPNRFVSIYLGHCTGERGMPKLFRNIWTLASSQRYYKSRRLVEIRWSVEFWSAGVFGLFFPREGNIINMEKSAIVTVRFCSFNSPWSTLLSLSSLPTCTSVSQTPHSPSHLGVFELAIPWSEHSPCLFPFFHLINYPLSF